VVISIKARSLVYAFSILILLFFTSGEARAQDDHIAPPEIIETVDVGNWTYVTALRVGEKSCFVVSGTSTGGVSIRCFDVASIQISDASGEIYGGFKVIRVSIGGEIECIVTIKQGYQWQVRCSNDVITASE